MPGDALKKVRRGDKLRIPAATFNAFVDAALDLRQRQQEQSASSTPKVPQMGLVRIKNTSGSDADRFAVLGIDNPVFTPTDNLDGFKNKPALKGVQPTVSSHTGKFAILMEPIKANAMGMGLISGMCPVKIEVASANHKYAEIKASTVANLKSAVVGPAQILWKESGTGTLWALVRLGVAPMPGMMFAVKVTQTGGSAGTKTASCSYTYTVKDLADQQLGASMTPQKARPWYGAMKPGSGYGLGFYDASGTFYLYDANETLDTESC